MRAIVHTHTWNHYKGRYSLVEGFPFLVAQLGPHPAQPLGLIAKVQVRQRRPLLLLLPSWEARINQSASRDAVRTKDQLDESVR